MELYSIRHQFYIAGCIYLGQMLGGYSAGWTSPVIPKLQDPEKTPLPNLITDQEASWMGSLLFVGTICGPYISGLLSNARGRKPCFVLGTSISILAYLVMALASNLTMVYIGRFLIGLGLGIIIVNNIVYIGEIASTHIRGVLLTCIGFFSTFGTLLCYIIGPYVPYSVTGYIGLAISLLFLVGIFLIPESPLHLILKDQKDKAKATLTLLGRGDEFDKMISADFDIRSEKSIKDQWTEIFTVRSNKRALFITLTLRALTMMSGIGSVVFFTTTIFNLAGSSIDPGLTTIMIGLTQVIASTIAPFLIERSGRKFLLVASSAGCCLSLSLLGAYFYLEHIGNDVTSYGWLPLVFLVIFMIFYEGGLGIIPETFIGEMFTSTVRSTGSTVALTTGWLFGFFVSSTFGLMIANGTHIAFWIYASSCAVTFIFSIIFVPETKGKSLLEIQDMLRGSWIK